jgi:hypothetical protein
MAEVIAMVGDAALPKPQPMEVLEVSLSQHHLSLSAISLSLSLLR